VNVHGRRMDLDDVEGAEVDQAGPNSRFLETDGYREAHGDPCTPPDAGKRAAWNLHTSLLGNGGTHCQDGYRHRNSHHEGGGIIISYIGRLSGYCCESPGDG
jgi:hypothetical protein